MSDCDDDDNDQRLDEATVTAATTAREKALALNLDATRYGAFAEIGGGQEVARWFFAVGGAAHRPRRRGTTCVSC